MSCRTGAAAAGLIGVGLLGARERERVRTWGASPAESTARLPGDELLEDADGVTTRAVEIAARPEAVWPWIVQMGPWPRAGAYTYDWIENLLGLDMHSSDRIIEAFQHPQVGETIRLGANEMRLARLDPGRALAWRATHGNWVWSFVLAPVDGHTRLLSRNRYRTPRLRDRLVMAPMEPASLITERKMLLGIRARAEQHPIPG